MELVDVDSITIVGDGDVGLINALMINQFNDDIELLVVGDKSPTQVGSATLTYMRTLLRDHLEINKDEFIKNVKPVWKYGAKFKNWGEQTEFFLPLDEQTFPVTDFSEADELQWRYDQNHWTTLGSLMAKHRKTPFDSDGGSVFSKEKIPVAYHLFSPDLNEYLRQVAKDRGIELRYGTVEGVQTNDGRISMICTSTDDIKSDLYIDATGFSRRLRSKLPTNFQQFDTPVDSAIVGFDENISLSDLKPYTVFDTNAYGWFWEIDTVQGRDMGFVYSSDVLSDDDAVDIFRQYASGGVEDIRSMSFTPGQYSEPWYGNCIAVGNAHGIIEPLEAPLLTTHADMASQLANHLATYPNGVTDGVRQMYNESIKQIWSTAWNYISVHYQYSNNDGEFWDMMRDCGPETPQHEMYQQLGVTSTSKMFELLDQHRIYKPRLFSLLLQNLGVDSQHHTEYSINDYDAMRDEIRKCEHRMLSTVNRAVPYDEFYDAE